MGLQRRNVQRLHQPLGGELVADAADRRRRRPDPGDALVDHRLGETGVLRQEAIAGVDRIGAGAPIGQMADMVVANILTNPLKVLAPLIALHTIEKGMIGLSGILESQAIEVVRTYENWFDFDAPVTSDGWVLLTGRRNNMTC